MSKKFDGEYKDFFEEAGSVCGDCGGELKKDKVNLEEIENGKLYMMEQVPALVCQQCGELWIPEPIIQEFEKMIKSAKNRKKKPPTKN